MRCPKCGYISFDHLEQCVKCKKNIKAVSDNLPGTVFKVPAPSFLHLDLSNDEEMDSVVAMSDVAESDDEFIDDDLEILADDGSDNGEEAEVAPAPALAAARGGKSTAIEEEDEDREIEIDLSQFEDAEEFQGSGTVAEKPKKNDEMSLALDLPEELNDLSDLAPPPRAAEAPVAMKSKGVPAGGDLGINGLDFDLGLNGLDEDIATGAASGKETVLALNDIDFSETLTDKGAAKAVAKGGGSTNMDEDLNFELDLGGLTLHKDI
jgi:hypothetical protein